MIDFPTVREQVEASLARSIGAGYLGSAPILAVVHTPEGMAYACGTCGWLAPGYGDSAKGRVVTHRGAYNGTPMHSPALSRL